MDAKFNIYLKRLASLEFRPESSALYFHVFTLPLFYVPYDFRFLSLDLLFTNIDVTLSQPSTLRSHFHICIHMRAYNSYSLFFPYISPTQCMDIQVDTSSLNIAKGGCHSNTYCGLPHKPMSPSPHSELSISIQVVFIQVVTFGSAWSAQSWSWLTCSST